MDEKIRQKNMFLTDKIALFGFRVGGIFYPIGVFELFLGVPPKLLQLLVIFN